MRIELDVPLQIRGGSYRLRIKDPDGGYRWATLPDCRDAERAAYMYLQHKYGDAPQLVSVTWEKAIALVTETQRARVLANKKRIGEKMAGVYSRQFKWAAYYFGRMLKLQPKDVATDALIDKYVDWLLTQKPHACNMDEYVKEGRGRLRTEKKGVDRSTANSYITALGVGFDVLVKSGLLPSNPMLRYPRFQEYNCVNVIFEASEIIALLNLDLPDCTKAVIALGCFAGLRVGESMGLKRKNVDLSHGLIRVVEQWNAESPWLPKRNSVRTVPISKFLRPYFEKKVIQMSPNVVTREDGRCFKVFAEFQRWYDELRRKGEHIIRPAVERAGPDRGKVVNLTHAFRRTFSNHFLNVTGNQVALSQLLGHSRKQNEAGQQMVGDITLRYAYIRDKTNRTLMAQFDEYIEQELAAQQANPAPHNQHV